MTEPDISKSSTVPAAKTGISRLIAASAYSAAGLKTVFKSEEAFRLEIYASIVMIPLGLWLGQGSIEKVLLVASVIMVLIIELFNTAIEVVINRIGKEYHELSGIAKDIGSACVLLGIGLLLFIWAMVLFY